MTESMDVWINEQMYTIEATLTTFATEGGTRQAFVTRVFVHDHLIFPLDKEEIEEYTDAEAAISRGFEWVKTQRKD